MLLKKRNPMRTVTFALALAWSTSAAADLRAVYGTADGPSLIVEVSDSGQARIEPAVTGLDVTIVRDGETFLVSTSDEGAVVTRGSDMELLKQELAELTGEEDNALRQAFGDPEIMFVPSGSVTLGGRTGTLYDVAEEPGSGVAIVISDDPALAPLAKAMWHYLESSFGFARGTRFYSQMEELFSKGAPLSFVGQELQSIAFGPLPSERFELPAEPQTIEQLRASFSEFLEAVAIPAND